MNFVFRIARLLFSLYAALLFGFSFFIVIPCYFIVFNLFPRAKAPHIAHGVSQTWAKLYYMFLFIRVQVKNKEFIDPTQTYVFVSNHLSIIDIPLFALSCSNTFRFLSKAELARVPVLGYIIRNLYITVNRTDRVDRSLSIQKMKQSLDEYISVFLCPEGTRNQTEAPLLPFKDGAFRLAISSGMPLAVLTVFNSNKIVNPARWFELVPGTIHASWSKPMNTDQLGENDVEILKNKARQIMLDAITEYRSKSGK